MKDFFPIAFGASALSTTALLVAIGLLGQSELAAEIGIVQAATLLVFQALSGNARSIALNPASPISLSLLLNYRLALLLPLGWLSYQLSAGVGMADAWLAFCLVLRRGGEWMNEIHLCERELASDQPTARAFAITQALLLLLAIATFAFAAPYTVWAMTAWALSPAVWSAGFVWQQLLVQRPRSGEIGWRQLLPNLGSTAMIAVSVYLFRCLILHLTDKATAGTLFAAYAVGSLLPTVFAATVGPSLTRRESAGANASEAETASATSSMRRLLGGVTWLYVLAGMAILAAAHATIDLGQITGKPPLIWNALGCSMLGGAIMLHAQRIRFKVLQTTQDHLLGPDVLSNLLIVCSVPYGVHLFGPGLLACSYGWNALLVWLFYAGALRTTGKEPRFSRFRDVARIVIAVGLCAPVFLQLSSGVFREASNYVFDSQGAISRLPIPLAVPFCFLGLLLLPNYRRASLSLTVMLATILLLTLSALLPNQDAAVSPASKFLLALQYLIPLAGLVLGQVYASRRADSRIFEKTALYILCAIVPLQLIVSWLHGGWQIRSYLYAFSIYQHLQYVPVIFVALFLLALFTLFTKPPQRRLLIYLAPLMAVYAVASNSMLAMFLMTAGMVAFAAYCAPRASPRPAAWLCAFSLACGGCYLGACWQDSSILRGKFGFSLQSGHNRQDSSAANVPENLVHRLVCWKHYADGIAQRPRTLLVGHASPPARQNMPSAHNYYLDLAYNFGVLASLPILMLIGYSAAALLRKRHAVFGSAHLVGLAAVVMFLVLADNSLKVGMRQPYPGMMTFFLWGLLLTHLQRLPRRHNLAPRDEKAAEQPRALADRPSP